MSIAATTNAEALIELALDAAAEAVAECESSKYRVIARETALAVLRSILSADAPDAHDLLNARMNAAPRESMIERMDRLAAAQRAAVTAVTSGRTDLRGRS